MTGADLFAWLKQLSPEELSFQVGVYIASQDEYFSVTTAFVFPEDDVFDTGTPVIVAGEEEGSRRWWEST